MAAQGAEDSRLAGAERHAGANSDHHAPLTVAAVAARLGVAASTLRTWDRRYGLGASSHEAGRHRRYTRADIARLETMRQLTLRGVAPADAARIALRGEGTPDDPAAVPDEPEDGDLTADPLTLAAAAVEPGAERPERLLTRAARRNGLASVWTDLVVPARDLLEGQEVAAVRRPGNDPLMVLESALLAAIRAVSAGTSTGRAGGVLVVADASHRVLGHVVAGALAQQGVRARVCVVESIRDGDPGRLLPPGPTPAPRALVVAGRPEGVEDLARHALTAAEAGVYLLGSAEIDLWERGIHRLRTPAAAVAEIVHAVTA